MRVSLNLTYEGDPDKAIVPLSLFALGLSHLLQHEQDKEAALKVSTDDDDIDEEFDVPRMLTERTIRQAGFVWIFHKTDADQWPSALHGHDYDKNMKLDALTGDIFDAVTKQRCATLKQKKLTQIQEELRRSRDFADRVTQLLGGKD
jgi:hypothetical protein